MKFVCLNCETYMNFEKVEKPAEGSLGVFFSCPSCEAKFSMVTNPGETQMVSSLGVTLGGRTVEAEPFEMTRGTLTQESQAGRPDQMAAYLNQQIQGGRPASPAPAASTTASAGGGEGQKSGGCPFSAVVAQMGLTSGAQTAPAADVTWTADAKEKLDRLPSFVRPMVQSSVEAYARKQGYAKITLQVMDDSKSGSHGVVWDVDAEKRLENIPDFIRPMARREIERLATERGATTITAQIMDDAKEQFMKFM